MEDYELDVTGDWQVTLCQMVNGMSAGRWKLRVRRDTDPVTRRSDYLFVRSRGGATPYLRTRPDVYVCVPRTEESLIQQFGLRPLAW